jgi:hypothetical protein
MLLFVLPAELFKFSAKAPAFELLFQLPPRMKTQACVGHIPFTSP